MLIAGEASGDAHAAGLVRALRSRLAVGLSDSARGSDAPEGRFSPRFFGAGGPEMAAAGVDLDVDLTAHAVFGLTEALRKLSEFRRLGRRLVDLACTRLPSVIVLVDFGGFNLRFAAAIRRRVRRQAGVFGNWRPKVVYFISPQVWASREGRARRLARDVDVVLSIIPFERGWYARRTPSLRVEFIGHPLVDRFEVFGQRKRQGPGEAGSADRSGAAPMVVLLPGSRRQEVLRHLPILAGAVERLSRALAIQPWMALPSVELLEVAQRIAPVRRVQNLAEGRGATGGDGVIRCQVGDAFGLMRQADLAIAKSGSVTLECAFHGLPTVVMYRVSWPTWWMARRLVRVPFAAMPNLLAGKEVYPELLQGAATPERIADEAEQLLRDNERRRRMLEELERVRVMMGAPGASDRAAGVVVGLLGIG